MILTIFTVRLCGQAKFCFAFQNEAVLVMTYALILESVELNIVHIRPWCVIQRIIGYVLISNMIGISI